MPETIHCHQCGKLAADNVGGSGTDEDPWEWECLECGTLFESNDFDPNDGKEYDQ